jgi:hypothetical protein
MNPSTPSNQRVEDNSNPDSSKVASDPKSEGKLKRKKDKARDRSLADTVDSEEAGDQIAADPDTTGDTSVVAEHPPPKKSRHPGWNHHQQSDEGGGNPHSCA